MARPRQVLGLWPDRTRGVRVDAGATIVTRDVEASIGGLLVGVIGAAPAEAALRLAFAEAERRDVALKVVAVGPGSKTDDVVLRDLVERWAEKYPTVAVRFRLQRAVDPAVTLVAATRSCELAVVQDGSDAASSAVIRAISRRAHSRVVVVPDSG